MWLALDLAMLILVVFIVIRAETLLSQLALVCVETLQVRVSL